MMESKETIVVGFACNERKRERESRRGLVPLWVVIVVTYNTVLSPPFEIFASVLQAQAYERKRKRRKQQSLNPKGLSTCRISLSIQYHHRFSWICKSSHKIHCL